MLCFLPPPSLHVRRTQLGHGSLSAVTEVRHRASSLSWSPFHSSRSACSSDVPLAGPSRWEYPPPPNSTPSPTSNGASREGAKKRNILSLLVETWSTGVLHSSPSGNRCASGSRPLAVQKLAAPAFLSGWPAKKFGGPAPRLAVSFPFPHPLPLQSCDTQPAAYADPSLPSAPSSQGLSPFPVLFGSIGPGLTPRTAKCSAEEKARATRKESEWSPVLVLGLPRPY
jgi:hypothetical protein